MKEENNFLSARQVSKILGIHTRTVQRLAKEEKIKAIRIGKLWKYTESDVNQYLVNGINLQEKHISDNISERRAYPRINSDLGCVFSVDLNLKRENINGTIKNLSAGGIFVLSANADVSIDDPVDINFILDKSGMNIKGRVIRKSDAGFGVIFRNLNAVSQSEIIKYVG